MQLIECIQALIISTQTPNLFSSIRRHPKRSTLHRKVGIPDSMPKLNLGFCDVIQTQPSSTAIEQVFSVLKRHFTHYKTVLKQG